MAVAIVRKNRMKFGVGAAAVIGLVAALTISTESGASKPVEASNRAAISVEVTSVELQPRYDATSYFSGRVTALRESELGFERGGLLAKMNVRVGDRVRGGDVLAELDTRQLRAQAAAIEARIKSAEAQSQEADARLKLAKLTADRQSKLFKAGHISAQRNDEARLDRDAVAAQKAAALAAATQARADLAATNAAIELSLIRAPFDGQVMDRYVDEGSVMALGGRALLFMEDGQLELRVGLPAAQMMGVEAGARYPVEIEGRKVTATLNRIGGSVDAATRTVLAIFRLDIEEARAAGVRPGMIGRLAFSQSFSQNGAWLPVNALIEGQRGLWSAYTVEPDEGGIMRVAREQVEVLYSETDRVFVRGTIKDGDQIISRGLHRLVPGQPVTVTR
ncbi:MAG: efflux RND transporter periplasmic adaptor subunit [Pseudomonadota bacterium]